MIKREITSKTAFYSLMDGRTKPIRIKELVCEIARITNQTIDSVQWTTFKSTKWYIDKWFLNDFEVSKFGNKRYVSWRKNKNVQNQKIISYDSNERETVRYFTLGDVTKFKNPVVAVNCSSEGYDAELLLKLNPKTTIHNIEVKKKVLDEYKKKGYNSIDHKMSVEEFFKTHNIQFDIIWVDCFCYVCHPLWSTLNSINTKKSTEFLFVTLKNTKGLRSQDNFSSMMKTKFKDSKELQKDIIDDVLSNYTYVDRYLGPSSLEQSPQKMTYLKYVRKNSL